MQASISGVKYANRQRAVWGMTKVAILLTAMTMGLLTGCGERIEGCLDTAATNFEVDADRNCCCEYPQLRLAVFPRTDTIEEAAFRANDTVFGALDTFIVREVRFVLSSFELVRSDGTTLLTTDSIVLPLVDGTSFVAVDDYVVTRLSGFDYTVGTLPAFGAFDSLRFTVGILPPASRTEPLDLPSDHPLADTTLFDDALLEYYAANVVVTPDIAADSINTNLPLRSTRTIAIPIDLVAEPSEDLTVTLRLYYTYLFEGIDFGSMSELAILQQLSVNLDRVFVP